MCTDCTRCCQVNGLHSWHSCMCSLLGSILEAAEDKWEACDSGYSREAFELSFQCSSLVSQKYLTKICLCKNPEFFGFFANSSFPSHSSSFFPFQPKSAYSWKFYLLWCFYFGVLHDLQGVIRLVEVQSQESGRHRRCLILLGSIMWLQWLRRSPCHTSTQLWKEVRNRMSNTVLSLKLLTLQDEEKQKPLFSFWKSECHFTSWRLFARAVFSSEPNNWLFLWKTLGLWLLWLCMLSLLSYHHQAQ